MEDAVRMVLLEKMDRKVVEEMMDQKEDQGSQE